MSMRLLSEGVVQSGRGRCLRVYVTAVACFLLLVAFEISCCRYISYSTMEWTGFTDEDLRRLQKSTSGPGNTLRG